MDEPEEGTFEDLVVPGTLERRVGEFGVAVLWALFCLMNFFPPSHQALAPWLFGPLGALASLHFMRRAFDRRPRLIVNTEGITDRTSLVGGSLGRGAPRLRAAGARPGRNAADTTRHG